MPSSSSPSAPPLIAWGLVLLGLAQMAACAPARVVTRDGEPWGCVADAQRLAQAGDSAPVVGWISSASLTRWIEVVDRIGQRAGVFAAGSSVQTRAQQDLVAALAKVGIEGSDWLDPTRPWHLIWQPGGNGKGLVTADHEFTTLLVPSQGADQVEAAAKKAIVGRHPSAPGVVIRLEDKKAWLSHLNHYTQLLTMRAAQHGAAAATATCLHDRRPRALLTAGVTVAELVRQRPGWVEEALSVARKEAGKPQKAASFVDQWMADLRELVMATEAVEMSADVDDKRGSLGLVVRVVADSKLARSFAAAGQLPPNPLLALLPAQSYLATASAWESEDDWDETRKSVNLLLDLAEVPAANRGVLLEQLKAMLQFGEPHSAAALFPAGGLAMAADLLWSSQNGHQQVNAIGKFGLEVVVQLLLAAKREAAAKGNVQQEASAEVDAMLALARDKGWAGLFGELATRSATWPVRLSVATLQEGDLRCDVLQGKLDWLALKRALPVADVAHSLVGEALGLAICATSKVGMVVLHAKPLVEARRIAAGKGGGLTETTLYREAMAGRPSSQWFALLNPGYLLDLARKVFDTLPRWPANAAIVSSCSFDADAARCRLDLPLAIADMVAPLTGGFGQ